MPYSESELVLPALEVISAGGVGTTELIAALRNRLKPSGADLRILKNRTDDHFSQKVRNLVSHDTLQKRGFVTTTKSKKTTLFLITSKGAEYCKNNSQSFYYLIDQGFEDSQRRKAADADFANIVIEEGAIKEHVGKSYERSKKLADRARQHFCDPFGKIQCAGCGFEGTQRYGDSGLGLIEIHHTQPLFLRGGASEVVDLKNALEALAPLCPNCHRVVHRVRSNLLSMAGLQKLTGYKPS